jgi:glycosyltransferase involved in cell wall biosynthesis
VTLVQQSSIASVSPSGHDLRLSILIRTLNEGDRIGAAIRSALPLGGEIVIIDAGSKDDTVEIAKSLGATVYINPWPGFGPQRYFGEGKCSHDMIFALDADEIITPEFAAELRDLLQQPNHPRLIRVKKPMVFPHNNRPPPFPYSTRHVYIYDRRIARTGLNPNWDGLEIEGRHPTYMMRSSVWHYSYRNWNHVVSKANYVAQLAADTRDKRPRWQLLLRLVTEFPSTFLKFYIFRRYFLVGADGFTMAMLMAFGRYLRIVKMLERRELGKD